jgi:hypothetical protein
MTLDTWLKRRVAWIFKWLMLAPKTYGRKDVIDELGLLLKETDRMLGGLPDSLTPGRRALLLSPRAPVVLNVDVYRYVTEVVRGSAVAELQDLVVRTGSLALMRRFYRYARGHDRKALRREMAALEVVLEVMTS